MGELPQASDPEKALFALAELKKKAFPAEFFAYPRLQSLLDAMAGNSDFLARLIVQQADFFELLCREGPQQALQEMLLALPDAVDGCGDARTLGALLRVTRQRMALGTAMADIAGLQSTAEVTAALSHFADVAITQAARFLLKDAHRRGMIQLDDLEHPFKGSGLLVIAMGKLGAGELNYSSDIDLILLFDPQALRYFGRHSLQHFFTRFAQDLSSLLQERSRDGYVFRVDLRLRPDPRSFPLAVNLDSAIAYYETLGQNWERAAMIKSRVVAGDEAAIQRFERSIQTFIWRKHLDFAAIADINSIKRQINARIGEAPDVPGFNVKLGRGGIREIEFFIQTKQLVWGGRDVRLRVRPTADALAALLEAEQITQEEHDELLDAYWYLRRVEHFLQMIDDQQTHTIPENEAAIALIARFLGYDDVAAFEEELLRVCEGVHKIYVRSMESSTPLSIDGNLVFTGVDHDPDTLLTLARLGFQSPQMVSESIQQWHRGGRRATRSLRARQMLTELVPALLTSLSTTIQPDHAFKRFDEFLDRIPIGVQIFSLITANTDLMALLMQILGSAPALGDALARNSSLLDIVLEQDFDTPLPDEFALREELQQRILAAHDYEECLRVFRQFKQEKQFLAGVYLLRGVIKTTDASVFLTHLAEVIIAYTTTVTQREFRRSHGQIEGGSFAILAMGKLGSEELTFDSDLDLVLIYDVPEQPAHSQGDKSVDAYTYYQRLASRLTHAFTLLTKEGSLYELDLRLRPGGAQSALATQLIRFRDYYQADAWDVERLALCRARVIHSDSPALTAQLESIVLGWLDQGYDPAVLAYSIQSLRVKIQAQHPTSDPWDVKHIRGGMMDIDLTAQFIRLVHPAAFKGKTGLSAKRIIEIAHHEGLLGAKDAMKLVLYYTLMRRVQHALRLCSTTQSVSATTSDALQRMLCQLMRREHCDQIREELLEAQAFVCNACSRLVSA